MLTNKTLLNEDLSLLIPQNAHLKIQDLSDTSARSRTERFPASGLKKTSTKCFKSSLNVAIRPHKIHFTVPVMRYTICTAGAVKLEFFVKKLSSLLPLIKCALCESIPRPTKFIKNTDQVIQINTDIIGTALISKGDEHYWTLHLYGCSWLLVRCRFHLIHHQIKIGNKSNMLDVG